MSVAVSRRKLLLGSLSLLTLATPALAQTNLLYGGESDGFARDPSLLPPPESPVDFQIIPANLKKIPGTFRKQLVDYPGSEFPGTIIVDPEHRHLYHVRENQQAIRYGVGVGREGFSWSGEAKIGMKRRWPRWLPPEEMVERDENAAKWANGMPGGPENPLGARALYLYANGAGYAVPHSRHQRSFLNRQGAFFRLRPHAQPGYRRSLFARPRGLQGCRAAFTRGIVLDAAAKLWHMA